jgi:hypothetical protein
MPNTFYDYVPRDNNQIDWASAASGVSKVLANEQKVRDKKKEEIDKEAEDFMAKVSKPSEGENVDIRQYSIQFGGVAEKKMMEITQDLKRGSLKHNEYSVIKQNMLTGTDRMLAINDKWQGVTASKNARLNEDISSGLESWEMTNAESYIDLNNTTTSFDDKGNLIINKKNKDGSVGDKVSISSLEGQLLREINKYDVESSTQKWTKDLGTIESVSRVVGDRKKAGQIITTIGKIPNQYNSSGERIMNKVSKELASEYGLTEEEANVVNGYIASEDKWIQSQISNPLSAASILTDYVVSQDGGLEYDFTTDLEEAKTNSNLILVERINGVNVPIFNEKINPNAKSQKEEISSYIKYSIRSKIGEEQSMTTYTDYKAPRAPQKWEYDARQKTKEDSEMVQMWNKLGNASPEQKQSILDGLIGTDAARRNGIVGIEFANGGTTISFINSDPSLSRLDIPVPTDGVGWVALGAEIHGKSGKKASVGFDNSNYNTTFGNSSSKRQGKSSNVNQFNNNSSAVESSLPAFDKKGKLIKDQVQIEISKLGGTVTDVKNNMITVTNANGDEYTFDSNGGTNAKKGLMSHLKNIPEAGMGAINNRNVTNSDPLGLGI